MLRSCHSYRAAVGNFFCWLVLPLVLFCVETADTRSQPHVSTEAELTHLAIELSKLPASEVDSKFARNAISAVEVVDRNMRVSLNSSPPTNDSINVYFFSSESMEQVRDSIGKFVGGCAYVDRLKSVFCDAAFVTRIIHYYDLHRQLGCAVPLVDGTCQKKDHILVPASDSNIDSFREAFINWIIIHEIGHARAGHKGSFFFASPKGKVVASNTNNIDSILLNDCQKDEVEADALLAKVFSLNDQSNSYRNFLQSLFFREMAMAMCPGISPSMGIHCNLPSGPAMPTLMGSEEKFFVRSNGRHPAFFVRTLLLIRELRTADKRADRIFRDNAQHYLQYALKYEKSVLRTAFNCQR